MKDKQGREYLKLAEAKEGMTVTVDGDFTCLKPWAVYRLEKHDGNLCLPCAEGHHNIDGQADDGIHCVGIYPGEVAQ